MKQAGVSKSSHEKMLQGEGADEVLRLRRQQLVLLLDLRLQRRDLLDTAHTDLSFRRGSPWGSGGPG